MPFGWRIVDRRQRQHRRHARNRRRARRRARESRSSTSTERPRSRPARRLAASAAAPRVHGRRPVDRPERAASARLARSSPATRARDRHPPGARLAGRSRRQARVHLARLQPILRARAARPVQDAQCGFKAIRADVARDCSPRSRPAWFFDTELLMLASAAACGSPRCRSTGSMIRLAVDIVATAAADLRGVGRICCAPSATAANRRSPALRRSLRRQPRPRWRKPRPRPGSRRRL